MKYIAQIQMEFIRVAASNWDDLSLEEQKGYLSRHPKSKRKLTGTSDESRRDVEVKKKLRGNWGQKQTLRAYRAKIFGKIVDIINDKYADKSYFTQVIPETILEKIKVDLLTNTLNNNDGSFSNDVLNKLISSAKDQIDKNMSELSENEKNMVDTYYDKSKELNLKSIESISSYIAQDLHDDIIQSANNMILTLRHAVSTDSNIDEKLNDHVQTKYKNVLDKDHELKKLVDELLTADISTHGGKRKDGTRIPGTNQYMEELNDDEIWKIFLNAERYRESRRTFKPHEIWALKYLGEHNPPLKMPFGKYKEKGWSAQDVITKDRSYSQWLTGKISEKDPDKRSPFEAWFIREYANEYLI